jgi:hypothetical protein
VIFVDYAEGEPQEKEMSSRGSIVHVVSSKPREQRASEMKQ